MLSLQCVPLILFLENGVKQMNVSNDEYILQDVIGCLIITEKESGKVLCCAEMTLHPVQLESVNMSSSCSSSVKGHVKLSL